MLPGMWLLIHAGIKYFSVCLFGFHYDLNESRLSGVIDNWSFDVIRLIYSCIRNDWHVVFNINKMAQLCFTLPYSISIRSFLILTHIIEVCSQVSNWQHLFQLWLGTPGRQHAITRIIFLKTSQFSIYGTQWVEYMCSISCSLSCVAAWRRDISCRFYCKVDSHISGSGGSRSHETSVYYWLHYIFSKDCAVCILVSYRDTGHDNNIEYSKRKTEKHVTNSLGGMTHATLNCTSDENTACRVPSQYKDRLYQVWGFPC